MPGAVQLCDTLKDADLSEIRPMSAEGDGRYDGLSREQLVQLLEKRDRTKRLGLVWERDEIEADRALEAEFIAAELIAERSDPVCGGGDKRI